jgi:hypothetical protein
MCSLSGAVWLYQERQILFFSSPTGNGMEEKNEPPLIKTVRDKKDTLIRKIITRRGNSRYVSGEKTLEWVYD